MLGLLIRRLLILRRRLLIRRLLILRLCLVLRLRLILRLPERLTLDMVRRRPLVLRHRASAFRSSRRGERIGEGLLIETIGIAAAAGCRQRERGTDRQTGYGRRAKGLSRTHRLQLTHTRHKTKGELTPAK